MTAAVDDYASLATGLDSPPRHWALVTPSDSADLAHVLRGFCFAGAGALNVTTEGGETLVIPSGALSAGQLYPGCFTRIWATSTTATGIVVCW